MNKIISEIINEKLNDNCIIKYINNNKIYIGSLSIEAFFSLSYTLYTIIDCIKYLLDVKKFAYILLGKLNNDLIKIYFCLMRSMSGANMALDTKSFYQNAYIALMRNIVSLCYNADRTFDRNQYKQFHKNVNKTIASYETVLSEQLKKK